MLWGPAPVLLDQSSEKYSTHRGSRYTRSSTTIPQMSRWYSTFDTGPDPGERTIRGDSGPFDARGAHRITIRGD